MAFLPDRLCFTSSPSTRARPNGGWLPIGGGCGWALSLLRRVGWRSQSKRSSPGCHPKARSGCADGETGDVSGFISCWLNVSIGISQSINRKFLEPPKFLGLFAKQSRFPLELLSRLPGKRRCRGLSKRRFLKLKTLDYP